MYVHITCIRDKILLNVSHLHRPYNYLKQRLDWNPGKSTHKTWEQMPSPLPVSPSWLEAPPLQVLSLAPRTSEGLSHIRLD